MIAVFLIVIPVLAGIINLFIKNNSTAKMFAFFASLATLVFALMAVYGGHSSNLHYDAVWLPDFGSRFTLNMDGMSKMLCLLNAIALPLIVLSSFKSNYANAGSFYGLILLMQAGIMGVFLAADCLLFYFFWELALIPAYFLCSIWGGEKRIVITFKFFIYTFIGSLLMLVAILMMYFKTPDHSFALQSFYNVKLSTGEEHLMFWLFFIAFAIKMPIFPLHTWQPDTYETAPTPVTMLLSGVMVKMGLYAVLRWLLPMFPHASSYYSNFIIILCIIGILYASLIAIKQDDIKRLIAYSSIAHIGLMCAVIFTKQQTGMQGVMLQMFNHGVNVIGLWIVAEVIEQQLGTRKFSELGGLAQKSPWLSILFVVMALANIALPLTNAFVGEFLMFNGLFNYNIWYALAAGVGIILAAVYTLNMIQKIFFGNTNALTETAVDCSPESYIALMILAVLAIAMGVYPKPMIDLTFDTVNAFYFPF